MCLNPDSAGYTGATWVAGARFDDCQGTEQATAAAVPHQRCNLLQHAGDALTSCLMPLRPLPRAPTIPRIYAATQS